MVRVLAALAGLLLAFVSTVFSLGIAFIGLLAMTVAAWWYRRRNASLSPLRSVAVCVGACTLAFVLGIGALFAALPEGSFEQMTAASEAQPKEEQPEWLQRMERNSPPQSQQVSRMMESKPVTLYLGLVGGAFTCLLFGAFFGAVAWLGGMLLRWGATERGPRTPMGRAASEMPARALSAADG